MFVEGKPRTVFFPPDILFTAFVAKNHNIRTWRTWSWVSSGWENVKWLLHPWLWHQQIFFCDVQQGERRRNCELRLIEKDKATLYMPDIFLCLCVDLQALLGPIYWADCQNHAKTTLWPQGWSEEVWGRHGSSFPKTCSGKRTESSQSDGRDYGVLPTDYCGKCGAWLARQPGQTEQTGGRYSEQVDDDGATRRDEFERGGEERNWAVSPIFYFAKNIQFNSHIWRTPNDAEAI